MSSKVIGTCSICGGPVTVPAILFMVGAPPKRCEQCGAIPVAAYGPVIPMQPAPRGTQFAFKLGTGCVGVTNGPERWLGASIMREGFVTETTISPWPMVD